MDNLGHIQNPPASKSTRSKFTQSNLRTTYQLRVRVRGNSYSKKINKLKEQKNTKLVNKLLKRKLLISNAGGF